MNEDEDPDHDEDHLGYLWFLCFAAFLSLTVALSALLNIK